MKNDDFTYIKDRLEALHQMVEDAAKLDQVPREVFGDIIDMAGSIIMAQQKVIFNAEMTLFHSFPTPCSIC